MMPIILIEVDHDGGTLRVSNRPFVTGPGDNPGNVSYADHLIDRIRFSRRLSLEFSGASSVMTSDIQIHNDGEYDLLLSRSFSDIRIQSGFLDNLYDDFRLIFRGKVESIVPRGDHAVLIKIRDAASVFDRDIQSSIYPSGPAQGRAMPLVYGDCFNIEPVLEDSATHQYRVHSGPIQDILAVRDNGVSVAFAKNNADGSFTLLSQPAGRITCDVQGHNSGGYLSTAQQTIQYLVAPYFPDMDLAAIPSYSIGIYIRDNDSLFGVIDQIIDSVGCSWFITRSGQFKVVRLDNLGDPGSIIGLDDIERGGISIKQMIDPCARYLVGYRRNWTDQSDGLAGSVVDRSQYTDPEQVATAINAGNEQWQEIRKSTLLVNAADAVAEATRLAGLYSAARRIYEIKGYVTGVDLGDPVQVVYPRFGLDAGQAGAVVGVVDEPDTPKTTIEVLA